jgi:hypothetical protein
MAMASAIDFMVKANNPGGAQSRPKQNERRSSRRCKITQLMRLRPSDPERDHFDDIRATVSMSRTGVYFHSSEEGYQVGMRLFVTMPYSKEATTMQREYLAEVVRRDHLPNGLFGIGFKILMEMGFQGGYSISGYAQRK